MDRFELLSTFGRVAETRSFTKAAASLGVSRATVSVAVRELEEHVGARLLQRTTRSVNLTSEGQLYYEQIQEILAKLEETDRLFRRHESRIAGRLSVDVPTRIARRVILPALPELLAQHPGLEVHLGASDRAIDLIEKGVDAVVRVGRLRDSSHIVRPLGNLVQINCASPRYLARAGQPQRLDDLAQHTVVSYGVPSRGRASWDHVEGGAERALPVRSVVSVDNAETYIAACLAGLGIIQIPAYDVRHYLESGALVEVLPAHVPAPLPISLLHPSGRQRPARLGWFAAWLTSLFERSGMFAPAKAAHAPRPRKRSR